MAIVSSSAIIRALSLFHLTLAYFFITNPRVIADQNLVYTLGQAMHLPHPSSMENPSGSTAFLAILLAFLGLSDFTAASLPEEIASVHWSSQTPVRLIFLFGLGGYIFWYAPQGTATTASGLTGMASTGEDLRNSVVFSWAFLELAAWFWVYTLLRDERRQLAVKMMQKRRAEEDRL